jgi:hypothetical protein
MNDKLDDTIYNHMVQNLKTQSYELQDNSNALQDYIQDLLYATNDPNLSETAKALAGINHYLYWIERNKKRVENILAEIMQMEYCEKHGK